MVSYSASFWLTNRGVLTAAFMVLMLCFIITGVVGVPAHDYARGYLGGTPYHSVWYMDAFLIPLALMLTFVGNLCKCYGKKRMAVIGPAVFIVGLVGSAASLNSFVFIGFRVVQGIGAAICAAMAGGYLNGGIGKQYSDIGKGLFVVNFAFGATVGISLAAYTTWYLSWRLIYAGLALLLFSAWVLIIRYMPADRGDPEQEVDWLTFYLICAGFGSFSCSLVVGNQHEWFQSGFYIILLTFSLIHIVLFFIRFAGSPPLLNPKVFGDINFVISCSNITMILFAVFLIFAIVPHFMELVIGNTVGTYATPFVFFAIASTATIYLFAPGINPHYIARSIKIRRIFSSIGTVGFGLTALWMAHTTSNQSNQNLTLQLISLGCCFGLIFNELLMAFATVPAELTTTASAVNFFGTNFAKSIAGGVSGAIQTASTQGSWERFRSHIQSDSIGLEAFTEPLKNHMIEGINNSQWSQASLELINHSLAKQAEVVSYINQATLTGFLLIGFGILPFLHREAKDKPQQTPRV